MNRISKLTFGYQQGVLIEDFVIVLLFFRELCQFCCDQEPQDKMLLPEACTNETLQ